jgi:acetyl esterase
MATLRLGVESVVLRAITGLPAPIIKAVTPNRDRDGLHLSPESRMLLRAIEVVGVPPLVNPPTPESRKVWNQSARMVGGKQHVGAVHDLQVDGAEGPLAARLYTPTALISSASNPTLLFFHGGGMSQGNIDSHDPTCRVLAEKSGVQVLSVAYRLAPEHKFPAGVDDCFAAFRWLTENHEEVHADPERIVVGGDSAGGHFAATTAIQAAEHGLPLRHQLLIYPVTDFVNKSKSRFIFSDGYYLDDESIERYKAWYFKDSQQWDDPLASVALRDSFPDGLAPATVITAGFDPLRDEGRAYAELLRQHGVSVEAVQYDDMLHGFINMTGLGQQPLLHTCEIAEMLNAAVS